MVPVLECVPNFSDGRDPAVLEALVDTIRRAGADVLDWSSDPDHHRSVVTFVGDPPTVERAAVEVALAAVDLIDLRTHAGLHPRVGATDVLPVVPFFGASMEDAVRSARDIGRRLAERGLPAFLYRNASFGLPKSLADLRRGGFERLVDGFPDGRVPDCIPPEWPHPGAHPTAGVTCVGARPVLLAWNVYLEGVNRCDLRRIAGQIREIGGGFVGLRALGFDLPLQGRKQISMNLEDLEQTSPFEVFTAIEEEVARAGGRITETEVIGLIPDGLVLPAAADRLRLSDRNPNRLLSHRLSGWLARRTEGPR